MLPLQQISAPASTDPPTMALEEILVPTKIRVEKPTGVVKENIFEPALPVVEEQAEDLPIPQPVQPSGSPTLRTRSGRESRRPTKLEDYVCIIDIPSSLLPELARKCCKEVTIIQQVKYTEASIEKAKPESLMRKENKRGQIPTRGKVYTNNRDMQLQTRPATF